MTLKHMLSEFIYGGMDGVITTVAIIGGALGANISHKYAFVLGTANVIADGFSMGISRYNSLTNIDKTRQESNSYLSHKSPFYSALATFTFFILLGAIPLLPFVLFSFSDTSLMKQMLLLFSLCAFILIGAIKGYTINKPLTSILETLLIGGFAAFISFKTAEFVNSQL